MGFRSKKSIYPFPGHLPHGKGVISNAANMVSVTMLKHDHIQTVVANGVLSWVCYDPLRKTDFTDLGKRGLTQVEDIVQFFLKLASTVQMHALGKLFSVFAIEHVFTVLHDRREKEGTSGGVDTELNLIFGS